MKYYSDKLDKLFDTKDSLIAAEKKAEEEKIAKEQKEKELKETRDARWKEVEDALKVAREAYNKYRELNRKFWDDYEGIDPHSKKTSWFDWLWGLWD